ncbi:non-ribosomal peptide synthetase [Ophiostoma piceae UAMH 11346]|uniref:Non-ribosomal peptide synthetase n=1 Tax=Ophiostoma piceae (strain UAMH 11346) TaxID=1262450 RepID=S3CQ60_OPHP1|nr:non-ribosomal peptide synthetase [Ophiostoma piceae UAMH 11346]
MEETQLSILNGEPLKLPGPELLHELLVTGAPAADGSPSEFTQPALDYQDPSGTRVTLSYPQLHGIATVLAAEIAQQLHALHGAGLPASPDSAGSADDAEPSQNQQFVVPVLIPQAPELYVSQLGILKAGGAFCPIQLDAPVERIRFILDDVKADIILTTKDMATRLPADRPIQAIIVDDMHLFDRIDAVAEYTPVKIPSPDDLAYVMYTSGSTGTPKGVGVPHIAATQSLLSHDRHIPEFQRFLQFAAPTFDVSVFEIFFPFYRGSTLVCANRAEMLNDLPHVIRSMNIDACELTPTVAGSLLRSRANAPDLRLLLTIGEMLTEPVIREFGAGPDRTSMLWAMYGPTEAAIHCTLEPALDGSASVRNIGFPLDTVSAYILKIPEDEENAPPLTGDPEVAAMGEVGELAVGGYQLACGYINRPEQTAAAFIDTVKYGRLYRTGDKARITENGLLECSGRMSGGQVKLRGQRIELGEVEQAVLRTSGCLGCAASVINGMLVAFCDVGPRPESTPEVMEELILESCRAWLPRFMIPNDIVQMADFPRLASGKVDRKRIASEYAEVQETSKNAASSSASVAASYKDDLDRKLHEIAKDILGTTLNSTSVLASSGLDSLKAIQFAAAIRSSVAPNASAVDVLESRTLTVLHSRIQALIAASEEKQIGSSASHILEAQTVASDQIPLDDIQLVIECNPIQTAMLAETMSNPKAYCNWVELEFANTFSRTDIVSAFKKLILNNESLRSGFVQHEGRFVQVVRKQLSENQVQIVVQSTRDFELDSDASLLSPFTVQVEDAGSGDSKAVHAMLHVHHAVYDGWSMDLMRQHLGTLLQGGEIQQQLQYSSVVQHYGEIPASQKNDAEKYWAESLNDFQPSPLPSINEHQENASIVSKTATLSGFDKAQVDAVARSIGSSPQAIFQAGLAWLWSSLLGSPDVVLGTVTSGRTLPLDGIESVVGPCLQTVPVRTDLSRMRTIRDLLTSTHSASRSLLAHAFLPFSDIKKTAGFRPGQPLYDALFVYQESLYSQKSAGDIVTEVAHQDYLETKLLWEVEPVDDGFQVRATFHTDAFPEAQVSMFIEQYASVLAHIVGNVDANLSTIAESLPQELLSCWNLDYKSFDGTPDLAHLVQEAAEKTPDSPALCVATSLDGDGEVKTLTFAELNALANRIASYLQSVGTQPGDTVAIIMDKSVSFYVGILGILKAGGAYLPLLPSIPEARAKVIVEQAKVQHCLTDTATHAALVSGLPVVSHDLQTVDLQAFSDVNPNVPIDGSRLAYVIYTSGSTGVPKGVCVTQFNICSNLDTLFRIYPVHKNGRLLQSCSLAFDVSVFEIFFTWIYGMCLCSAVNDVLFEDLERGIRLLGATHLSMTPTVASLIDPLNTPSVEFLVTAGEAVTESIAKTWSKHLYQGYGPSEVTNICTVRRMVDTLVCNLGPGLENTSSIVLQVDGLDPVPVGAVGEMCFGGDQVVSGYLGQPELTAEKFIQHPSFGRIYRTGDIGRMLPDGSLRFISRVDNQIKLRGQRIELNEINSVLRDSGLLLQVVTLPVRQEDSGSDQLASFIVPSGRSLSAATALPHLLDLSDKTLLQTISQLFNELSLRLPSYMVPSFLFPISGVPLTPSGKTNSRALLSLFSELSQDYLTATSYVSEVDGAGTEDSAAGQWTDFEKQLAQILADALSADVQRIGRWTPLASLGLDSLSAIRVSKVLSSSLEKRIAISDILKNMSVAQLAQVIEKSVVKTKSSAPHSVAVFSEQCLAEIKASLDSHHLSSTKVLPCMPLQEAMLVSPVRGRSYVNRMLFQLQTSDLALVKEAWLRMCTRHEILRTCFATTDHASHPIAQVVLESYPTPWIELVTSDAETVDSFAEKHAQTLSSPVDAFQPPVSFAVIKQGDESFLSFVCHHAVYDGEAMGLLLSEVESIISGQPLATEAAPSFEPFLAEALVLPASTDNFWTTHLQGFRPALLASDKSANTDISGVVCKQALDVPLSVLQGQAKELGFSLLTTCQSAWACVLSVLSEADDVCFGNVYNGRSIPVDGVDRLVAPCFNTLPVRAALSTFNSSKDLLAYFQALNPELMQYQFTPLRKIQRLHLGGMRLFDSLLLLQQPSQPLDSAIWTLLQDDGEMDIPLVCELVPDQAKDEIEVRLHSESNVLPKGGSALILELFSAVIKMLLKFSSSQIPARHNLSQSLQDSLQGLKLEFEHLPLPEDEAAVSGQDTKAVEMWTPTESKIRVVLSQLSGIPEDSIRRDTTIYRLGLDSIRAVQVASVLRKGGLQVSAVDVMEHPSCTAMASFLSKTTSTSNISEPMTPTSDVYTPPSSPSIASSFPLAAPTLDLTEFKQSAQSILDKHCMFLDSEIEAVLPCTPLQAGLLTEFFKSNGQHYFNYISFNSQEDSSADLTGQAWKDAWRHAASSIPMLRTGFINIDSAEDASSLSPYAMIQISAASMLENHVQVHIIKESESSRFDVTKWRANAAGKAFSNTQLPPWQVAIVESDCTSVLTCHLAIHHALYDAASLQGIFDTVSNYIMAGEQAKQHNVTSTEATVADILHKVTSLTGASSAISSSWKDRVPKAVVNSFPTLTPLKVSPAEFHVLSKVSVQPLADLQAAVRTAGFTLNAVLQAAWARILSSYIGDAPVVFGAVLSGRNTEATENALFPCISTLPVVATNKTHNRELVEQLMETNILLHKSQHVPLSQIQRWLGQPDTRLFDTLIVYQAIENQLPGAVSDSPAHPWTIMDEKAIVDYPVSLEAIPHVDNKFEYQITFDTSVLPKEHAHTLLNQFDAVVTHLAFNPDASEDDLVPVDSSLYSVLRPRDAELSSEIKLMHQFVEVQAEKQPQKTALQFVTAFDENDNPISTEWSYQELNDRGNKVATLVAQHAQPGSIVAICFDKCPEAFFTMLGIFKAGCSYLALDPSAPAARKEFILEDSGSNLLLTEALRAQTTVLEGGLQDIKTGVQVISIEESVLKAEASPDMTTVLASRRETLPSDISYCLYTSGTTGTPKGCAITHENGVQCMLAFQELFNDHYDADSKWLQFASFHFDVAVVEQYWTWSVGITLVGAPRDLILEDLAGTIARLEITHIDLTPSLGRMLNPKDVPSLCRGVFITGGEPLKQEMLDPWGPTGAVHNFYGPTEATIGVTSYPQVPQNGRASNIGRQFPNVGSFVFRPNTQTPVLRGAVGELCVSGKLVGKGYLNREELTNDRFPTLSEKSYPGYGERIYRTGDLVRLLHDGCFDFLGRADDQVKLRGQRLEIGEINHAIRLGVGSSIGDVATLVIRDKENKKDFLVSFVVVADETAPADRRDISALKVVSGEKNSAALSRQVQTACRERLPGYMVPTYVVQLPFIPLSPNNKAEAKELKRLFNSLTPEERMRTTGSDNSSDRKAELHQSPSGKIVLDVFKKLSLVSQDSTLSPDTSIFELGVDSISVLRLARSLKRAGLAAATPSLVLTHPLVGELVAALDTQRTSSVAGPVVEARLLIDACQHRNRSLVCQTLGIDSEQIEYIAPCSALQQGMISRSRSGPEHKDTYFNAFEFTLKDGVPVDELKAAWEDTISKNSVLRTQFVATSDGFVQVALRTASFSWSKVNLSDDDDLVAVLSNRHAAWVEANQDDTISQPLDIFSLSWRGKNIIVVHIFHALYDAASLDLILGQVAASCNNTSAPSVEHPSFLEALTYGPLRNYSNSRQFWEDHMRGSSLKQFPVLAKKTSSSQSAVSASRTVPFAALEQLRVSLGITHSTLVQALWVSVLQKIYNGSATLGLVLSGRTIDDLDNVDGVVGPLFNTLPFHAVRVLGQSWASLAQSCYTFSTTTLPFQQVPLRDIQKWCSAGQPLFDVLFSFQFADGQSTSTKDLWTQSEPKSHADYPLALEVTLNSAGEAGTSSLQLLLVAKTDIADEAALDQILDDFENALQAFSTDPLVPVFGADDIIIGQTEVQAEGIASASASREVAAPSVGSVSFEWSDAAVNIRREMAGLASVPEESISETTTLLELGLDSVDTIKLSARLRKAGVRISNSQLVRGQTIVSFLNTISESTASSEARNSRQMNGSHKTPKEIVTATSAALKEYLAASGRDLSSVTSVLPPTPLQEAMVADMIQSNFAVYFNNDVLELSSDVDVILLKKTWAHVIEKNPILRTVFFTIDSPDFEMSYCQAVQTLSVVDHVITEHEVESKDHISTIANDARQKAITGQGESNLFQLDFVHTTDENRWYLVLSISHALYDGWSLELLHTTVESTYRKGITESDNNTEVAEEAAYASQLGRIFQSSGPQADGFWKSFLNGAQPTYVQRQSPGHGSDEIPEKSVVRVESTSSIPADALVQFCKRQSTSVQVVGQACWAAVLSSLTSSLDVLFGVVLSGRDSDGADEMMFPTMNTVPVRVVLHGTTPDLLQYMQANMGTISEYQHYPLRKAQKHVRRNETSAGESGIFNTLFILQKRVQNDNSTGTEAVPLMKSVGGASDVEYPICIEMEIVSDAAKDGDTIVWRTACDRSYVSGHGASRMLHQLDVALRFLIQTSSAPTTDDGSILKFEDDGVSVCGLPPFSPKMHGAVTAAPAFAPVATDSSVAWSDDELAIRSVLSSVSGLSEDVIFKTGQTLYHLGLDSISTIKVSSLLKKTKGLALGVRDMLSASSIEEMASIAAAKKEKQRLLVDKPAVASNISSALSSLDHAAIANAAGVSPSDVEQILPANAAQTHLISVWQNTNGQVFFPEFRYRLKGQLAQGRRTILAAWTQLVDEYPILRTTFVTTAADALPVVQVVLKRVVDRDTWSSLGSSAKSFAILSAVADKDGQAFSLSLKIHHALYDAVSLQVLLARLQALCQPTQVAQSVDAYAGISPAWVDSLSIQSSETVKQHNKTFWSSYFASANIVRPTSATATANGRVSHYRPAALPDVAHLKEAATKYGVSLQSLVFAVYAKLRASQQQAAAGTAEANDVVFGIYLANRDEGNSNALAGFPTLCLVPLIVRSPAHNSLVGIAAQIQKDIHAISSQGSRSAAAPLTAALWEIREWTGVSVDSFVNFLLPDVETETQNASHAVTLVIEEASSVGEAATSPLVHPSMYPALQNNRVQTAYDDAVDVEVAVRNNRLDVGVFGSAYKLGDDHGAQDLVARLAAALGEEFAV